MDWCAAAGRDGSGTSAGSVVGTWRYALSRSEDLGPPCDLYALGVTLYELLTGGALFPSTPPRNTNGCIACAYATRLEQLEALHGKGAMRFLQKALQKKPADRYATAQAMLQALTDIPTNSADGSLAKKPWQFVMPLLGRAGQLSRPAARHPNPGSSLDALFRCWFSSGFQRALRPPGGVGFMRHSVMAERHSGSLARQLPGLPTPAPRLCGFIPAEPERNGLKTSCQNVGSRSSRPMCLRRWSNTLPPDPPYTPPVNSSRPSTMVSGSRRRYGCAAAGDGRAAALTSARKTTS